MCTANRSYCTHQSISTVYCTHQSIYCSGPPSFCWPRYWRLSAAAGQDSLHLRPTFAASLETVVGRPHSPCCNRRSRRRCCSSPTHYRSRSRACSPLAAPTHFHPSFSKRLSRLQGKSRVVGKSTAVPEVMSGVKVETGKCSRMRARRLELVVRRNLPSSPASSTPLEPPPKRRRAGSRSLPTITYPVIIKLTMSVCMFMTMSVAMVAATTTGMPGPRKRRAGAIELFEATWQACPSK